jgi:hypothetical protein
MNAARVIALVVSIAGWVLIAVGVIVAMATGALIGALILVTGTVLEITGLGMLVATAGQEARQPVTAQSAFVRVNDGDCIYEDKLLEITEAGLRLKLYYFPWGSRTVRFSEIDHVVVHKTTVATGAWRLWGSGDLHSWFACDMGRPQRPMIFLIKLIAKSGAIGFTAVDSYQVLALLRERVPIRDKR